MAILIVGLSACVRPRLPTPEGALRQVSTPRHLFDDLGLEQFKQHLSQHIAFLNSGAGPHNFRFGAESFTRAEYLAGLRLFADILERSKDEAAAIKEIGQKFKFYEVYGDRRWGDIFLTSYFEPVISASRKPDPTFSRALYRAPSDLLKLDLSRFGDKFGNERKYRGRVFGREFLPYFTREEIDSKLALAGKGLEICWVDPIDAFFLQIQGSGTVRFADGQEMRLAFAEKNGAPYEAIGRFLKEQIAPQPITLQSIESYLRTLPAVERDHYLNLNPSYVFFRESEAHAVTSIGISASEGRTIATDPRYFPKGALAFLQFEKPTIANDRATQGAARFVLDQDSGGAITGPGRVDLFWGRGDEAKHFAGITKGRGKLFYLAPKR